MNEIFTSIVLGVVEGVTEFLPISSTGHLIIVSEWFSFGEPFTTMFNIVIQLGAILAVIVLYHKRLSPFKKTEHEQKKTWSLWKRAIIGVVPALILGFIFSDFIETNLFNPLTVAIMLIIGGFVLILVERKNQTTQYEEVEQIPFQKIVAIGFIQCLAMIPGTSRSAASIIGARLLGASRSVSVEFSFFLAIPTMLAATSYSLLSYSATISQTQWFALITGFITSFIVAVLVIRFFIHYIQKHSFVAFGYYRVILGLLIMMVII